MPPVKLQFVFQGGGAKLCLLMAACHALNEMKSEERIDVTRVAGSSAGAIAAAMLASGKPISAFREMLLRHGESQLAQMTASKYLGAWRVLNGQAYFHKFELEDFFNDLFCKGGGPQKIENLNIETRIFYTDLYSLGSQRAASDMALPQALAKSCRFPFAFGGYASKDSHVDGGLALNLPVDGLQQDASIKGSVLAVSFFENFPASTDSPSMLSYTQQLFSAAVQSGVVRSQAMIGRDNVYLAETDIGTFDFKRAIEEGLEYEAFERESDKFRDWLERWLREHGPITPEKAVHAPRLTRPSMTTEPWRTAVIRDLSERVGADACLHAERVSMFDVAQFDAEGNPSGLYLSRSLVRFRIIRRTNVLQFTFEIGKNGTFLRANLGCAVTNKDARPLKFVPHVEEIGEAGNDARNYRVFFLFDEPLTPESAGQPFSLEYEYVAPDPYPKLGQEPEAFSLMQWQGPADLVLFGVAFPRSKFSGQPSQSDIVGYSRDVLESIGYNDKEQKGFVQSSAMNGAEFMAESRLELPYSPDYYFLAGRRAEKVQHLQSVGVIVE